MKTGFVYIWYDRKHKRYYIGSHWGAENDGYVCSSRWMRNAYKRRPHDFKRRIVSTVDSNRGDLLAEEYRWLQMISKDHLGSKYYNLTNHLNGHWATDNGKTLTVKQKLSATAIKNHADPEWRAKYEAGLKERNNKSSELEVREKRRQSMLGKNVGRPKTNKFYEAMTKRQGTSISDQHKQSIKDAGTFKKLNSTIVSCSHCGAVGNPGNIARYHNDRCKQKVSIT